MPLSRRLDDKERSSSSIRAKIFSPDQRCRSRSDSRRRGLAQKAGHRLVQLWYYRDRALCSQLGVTPLEMLLAAVGSSADRASGGRQRPSHWGHTRSHRVGIGPDRAPQVLHAVGSRTAASSTVASRRLRRLKDRAAHPKRRICMRIARRKLDERRRILGSAQYLQPVSPLPLPRGEDNGYAISVPVEVADTGRQYLASRAVVPRPACRFDRRHRFLRRLCCAVREATRQRPRAQGPAFIARARHPALLPTHPPTTKSSISRRRSRWASPRKAGAIRSRGSWNSLARRPRDRRGPGALWPKRSVAEVNDAATGARGGQAGFKHRRALGVFTGCRSGLRRLPRRPRAPRASPTRWCPPSTL